MHIRVKKKLGQYKLLQSFQDKNVLEDFVPDVLLFSQGIYNICLI